LTTNQAVSGLNPDRVTKRDYPKDSLFLFMFTTYILFSKTLQKFYIGFTAGDMNERLYKHLSNHTGFTAKAKDWVVVYTENFPTKNEALAKEKQLKNWKSNKRVKELILRSTNFRTDTFLSDE
jgi:putative endonuclease